ncbi:MAG: hypothetical protein WCO23_02710 [bacterium]
MKKNYIYFFVIIIVAATIFFTPVGSRVNNGENSIDNINQTVDSEKSLVENIAVMDILKKEIGQVTQQPQQDSSLDKNNKKNIASDKGYWSQKKVFVDTDKSNIQDIVSKEPTKTMIPIDANTSYAESNIEETFLKGATRIEY